MSASENLNLKYTLDVKNVVDNARAMAKAIAEAEKRTVDLAETNKRLKQGYDEALRSTQKIPASQKDVANTMKDTTSAVNDQKDKVKDLTLSWKSFERYLLASLARRAVYQIISGIREGLREAIELNKRIAEIQTISQDNARTTDVWAQGLRSVSDAFGLDILDTAESAYQALSNQVVDATNAIEFMRTTSEFAITTLSSQADSVNLVSSAIKSFELNTEDADYIAASFFKTIELGRLRAEEMANTFGRVSVLAGQLGGDLDELNAFLATTTIRGLKFREAATQVRGVMLSLIKPTEDMSKFLQSLGYESGQAAVEALGFQGVLREMSIYMDGSATAAAKLVPRVRGLTGLLAVARDGGIEYAETLDAIRESQESYIKATVIATETAGRQLDIALTRIKNFFTVDLGLDAVEALATINKEFVRLDLLVINVTKALGYLAAGFGIVSLGNPFVAAIVGATALITLITKIQQEEIEAIEDIRKAEKRRNDSFARNIDSQERVITRYYNDLRRKDLVANAEIRVEWDKTSKILVARAEEISEAIEETFKDISKGLSDSVKEADKRIQDAKKSIDDLAKSSKAFIADLQEEIFREGLKDLNISEQINALGREIERVEAERIEALKAGATELAQEKLKEQAKLEKEITKLDRDRVEVAKKLAKEEAQLKKDSQEDLAELQEKLSEAQRKRDLKAIEDIKGQIRTLTDVRVAELRRIEEARSELEDDSIGKYVANYKERYQELINIQIAQQEELKKAELRRIDEITEYRKAKELELKVFEATIKGFSTFDLGKAVKGAKTEEDINKIAEDRKRAIEDVARVASTIADEQTKRTVLSQLAELQKTEARVLNIELLKQELDIIQDILKARQKQAEEEREAANAALKARNAEISAAKASARILQELPDMSLADALGGTVQDIDTLKKVIELQDQLSKIGTGKLTDEERVRLGRQLVEISEKLPKGYRAAAAQLGATLQNVNTLIAREVELDIIIAEREATIKNIKEAIKGNTSAVGEQIKEQRRLNLEKRTTAQIEERQIALQRSVSRESVQNFAAGGQVGYGSDTVPAMLTPGEYVVNAKNTRKFYSQLVGMNSSNAVQKMNSGGDVSVGDININMTSSGNENYDVQRMARSLNREIRRGTVKLR